MSIDFFGEDLPEERNRRNSLDPNDERILESDPFVRHSKQMVRKLQAKKAKDKLNEVGVPPPVSEEILAERAKYRKDFVLMHQEVFPESTGVRPFGKAQENSIRMGQDVFDLGVGRLLKLEPRGFAKTTRIANEAVFAALEGMQDFIVIAASNLDKAEEILMSIKVELMTNEQLFRLYPGPIACFRHLGGSPGKANYQTSGGEKTHIEWSSSRIIFPSLPNEPQSAGVVIDVHPISNLKGLVVKVKAGPRAGQNCRPKIYIFDDPQTFKDGTSEASVKKIIGYINRDAMKGGSHSHRAAAIMAITPVAPGDVAWHFAKLEHSWDLVMYKMLEKRPEKEDWWMNDYAKVYLDYDRRIRGDRIRAAMEARKLVEENYDEVHEGAVPTWDHAYGWNEEPQTEISAVQHAYNMILDDGLENFEFECQCNIDYGSYEEGEQLNAPTKQILSKTLPYRHLEVPQDTAKVVAHIDVNKEFLSYVVMASPMNIRPHIIDYGTFPKQPSAVFTKRKLLMPLSRIFPELTDYRDVLYSATKKLVETLANTVYQRSDGVPVRLDRIGVDIRFEEVYITRALVECAFPHLVRATFGMPVGPDDDLLHEKNLPNALQVFQNCYIQPNKARSLDVLYVDVNFFKTQVHRGFNMPEGVSESLSLYGLGRDGDHLPPERHLTLAQHHNIEKPMRKTGLKKHKTKITWATRLTQPDNEYFDNTTGCYALLCAEGVQAEQQLSPETRAKDKKENMADFILSQKGKNPLD